MNRFDMPEISFEQLTLERMKIVAQGAISPQLLHDAEIRTVVDMMTDSLIVQFRSHVYAHKLESREATYEIEATATASYVPRYRVVLPAALVIAAAACGVLLSNVWLVAWAAIFALAFIAIFASNPPQEVTKTKKGFVDIQTDYFNTFPDNQTVYPKELGNAVKVMMHRPPVFRSFEGK